MPHFDVIIIGGGVGGAEAAFGLVNRGKQVAIVEERDWGGVTINRGSTPKRALLASAETHFRLRQLGDTMPLSWPKMAAHSAKIVTAAAENFAEGLATAGVTLLEGHATFTDTHTIGIHGQQYQADQFIIATGARPRSLDFPGSQYVLHSASFLKTAHLPADITIIGAGIIAFAFASIASEAGSHVTIIQRNQRALANFDQEFVQALIARLTRDGVDFKFASTIQELREIKHQSFEVVTAQKDTYITNAIYDAAGRVPNFEDMNLDVIGVQTSVRGISVNDHLQTAIPSIYALGDCCDAPVPKLGSYAMAQGKYVGDSVRAVAVFPIKYPLPVSAVFSIPKLGQVGISTQQAAHQDDLTVRTIDLHQWQTYARTGDELARLKLVVNTDSQRIVGAEVISQDADLLADFLALLINQHISADDLSEQMFAYPSLASDLYGIWQSK